ncbi:putative ribonuclease YokI [Photorhabdus australis subsp. thailandensis]|uniref:Putative ribonuclease YokI n=1 Tax=Photorhabdus australis subsp. thailandensis TaxID=2805096 RepID=A0A1C0U872_9GAMM|nr:putative ribonuclease YokI [Photorhabdus australis subsp. thailandensis]
MPEAACYLSPDPLGLAGGVNPYSYVHNPANWVDPLGLTGCPVKEFDIVPYRPTTSPLENHHGVLDIWMAKNVPEYGGKYPKNSPTIALSKDAHDATKSTYRDWLREKTGKPVGGKIDWNNISNREMHKLTEKMFDSANVPQVNRGAYYRALNQYLYSGSFDPVKF